VEVFTVENDSWLVFSFDFETLAEKYAWAGFNATYERVEKETYVFIEQSKMNEQRKPKRFKVSLFFPNTT